MTEGVSSGVELVVVAVTYNAASVVGAFLDSLPASIEGLASTQIVVVDNGSADATTEVVRAHPVTVTVVETGQNLGYAAGFNAGVKAARPASAYAIVNPDLILQPGALTRLVETLRETGAGIAVPRLEDDEGALLPSLRRDPSVRRAIGETLLGGRRAGEHGIGELVLTPAMYERRTPVDWASGAAMIISAECLQCTGPWDASFFLYSEETEYCLRARDHGFRVIFEPRARAMHIGGDAPHSPRLWALQRTNSVRLFARRHGWLRGQMFRGALAVGEFGRALWRRRPVHQAAWRALVALHIPRDGAANRTQSRFRPAK